MAPHPNNCPLLSSRLLQNLLHAPLQPAQLPSAQSQAHRGLPQPQCSTQTHSTPVLPHTHFYGKTAPISTGMAWRTPGTHTLLRTNATQPTAGHISCFSRDAGRSSPSHMPCCSPLSLNCQTWIPTPAPSGYTASPPPPSSNLHPSLGAMACESTQGPLLNVPLNHFTWERGAGWDKAPTVSSSL